MYLPDVEKAEAEPFEPVMRALREAGEAVPQILRLFAFKPGRAAQLLELSQDVMRGPSPLSPGLRELIAAFVSRRNDCVY